MAFQRTAFQSRADSFGFQVERTPEVTAVGGRIVAGTFSRGQWRDLKQELEVKRVQARKKREAAERALAAERTREIERIAAEIAARRAEEDRTVAEKLKALWGQGLNPQGLSAADLAAAQAFHANRLAALAQAKREAQEEEEALALLMQ